MSALAILARTDAYYHATQRQRKQFLAICSQEISYQGSALVVTNSPIERAVETTRHLILVHPEEREKSPLCQHLDRKQRRKNRPLYLDFPQRDLSSGERGRSSSRSSIPPRIKVDLSNSARKLSPNCSMFRKSNRSNYFSTNLIKKSTDSASKMALRPSISISSHSQNTLGQKHICRVPISPSP